MSEELQHRKFKLTSVQFLAISGMVITGLVLLVIYSNMIEKTTFSATLLSQISSALLIGGIWTGFYELLQKRDFIEIQNQSVDRIVAKIPDVDHFGEVGLYRTETQLGSQRFRDMIEHSNELTIVINDGRTWVSNYIASLETRFADKSKKTNFIFLHPDSTFIPNLVTKLGVTEEGYRDKIRETVKLLREHQTADSNLKISGHRYFNPHTVFLSEKELIVTPYFYSRSRKTPPTFFYRDSGNDCYYKKVQEDINTLRLDCEDIPITE